MFEKEIKFIGDFCINQVKNVGTIFTYEKISATNIHPAVLKYISAELDFMIYADRRKLLQQSYFDYSGKEIADHFHKISGEIKRNKKISFDDLKKLILQAVSFNVNYLVRPRWSLTKLIFNEQPIISVEELQMMLNYLYYYEYFKKVLSAYLSKRNLVQISLTEFDLILNKIDRELFSSNQEQLVDNALTSIGDFFNIGGVDKNMVSSTAIEIFLKEKNMLEMVFKLRKEIPEGVKKRYDKVEFKRILYTRKAEGEIEQFKTTEPDLKIDDKEGLTIDQQSNEEPSLGEIADKYANELDKADIESFLSPEEEETLLSLYDEELKSDSGEDLAGVIEEASENSVPNSDDTFESNTTNEDNFNAQPDLKYTDSLLSDSGIAKSTLQIDSDLYESISEQLFESEPDVIKPGVEKEIVEEMIKDFIGEENSNVEEDKVQDEQPEKNNETVKQNDKPKFDSLEAEVLNIFEDIDKFSNNSASEEISIEEVNEVIEVEESNEPKELLEPVLETDEIDEFLKNIDEAAFSGKGEKVKEEVEETQVKEDIEPPQKKVEVREIRNVEKKLPEQELKQARPSRHNDLFGYLKKKEIKKIVSLIFSNDEEDFINTAERIMDCHSYKEASEILKAVFTSYKISPYSKEAITFTNGVSNYFRQA